MAKTYEEWLQTRPPVIQALAREFPPHTSIVVEGESHYVIGWNEEDMVIISPVNPSEDYAGAVAAQQYVCAAHLRKGSTWQ